MTYYFEVESNNPSGNATSLPLDVSYLLLGNGAQNAGVFNYSAVSQIQLFQDSTNAGLISDEWATTVGHFSDGSGTASCFENQLSGITSFSGCTTYNSMKTVTINISPNTLYRVVLADNITDGNTLVTDIVDPFFQIDPGFSGAPNYSIVLSNGVGNSPIATPEPSGVHLVGIGIVLGLLNLLSRSKSFSKPQILA